MKKPTPHPGFGAQAVKGKQHPGFRKVAAHEAKVNRPVGPVGPPSGPQAAPAQSLAPVMPIGPPQMPGAGGQE